MKNYIQVFMREHGLSLGEEFYVLAAVAGVVIGVYRFESGYVLKNALKDEVDSTMLADLMVGRYRVESMESRRLSERRKAAA